MYIPTCTRWRGPFSFLRGMGRIISAISGTWVQKSLLLWEGRQLGPKWRRHCVSFWKERIPVDISNSPTPGQRCFLKFNLCYFVTAFWLCNLHSVEFNHFIKVYNSVNFSVSTELCVHLAINLRTFFITPRRNWYLLTIIPISLSPSLWSP